MAYDNTNKPKAVWTDLFTIGENVVKVSNGGAVGIFNERGMVLCFRASQLEEIHLVMTSLSGDQVNEIFDTATNNKAKKKVAQQVEKEIGTAQNRALAGLQALADIAKSKGLNPETYIAQVLSGKTA
jgi:hypothetical protein